MVRIYVKTEQVAVHQRNYKTGGYSTCKEHLCSQHRHYLDRSPGYYKNKALAKSKLFYQVVEKLFDQDKYPEQLYRTCDGLLGLQRKTDEIQFEKAYGIALEHGNCSYGFIQNIIRNKMTETTETTNDKPLPAHQNIRGARSFE